MGETEQPDFFDAFRGQTNGLCGAAVRGVLVLVTGLHTGQVGFTVDVLDAPPPLDDTWEEIVEASFFVGDIDPDPIEDSEDTDIEFMGDPDVRVTLIDWGGMALQELPLPPGNYRVRYCARGMQLGRDRDTLLSGEDLIDFIRWPSGRPSLSPTVLSSKLLRPPLLGISMPKVCTSNLRIGEDSVGIRNQVRT